MLAQALCCPTLTFCWPILDICRPILPLCWPKQRGSAKNLKKPMEKPRFSATILGLGWPILEAMLAHLGAMLTHLDPAWGLCWPIVTLCWPNLDTFFGLCWAMLTHLEPQSRKNARSRKHCKTPDCTWVGGGRRLGRDSPLSFGEERWPTARTRPQPFTMQTKHPGAARTSSIIWAYFRLMLGHGDPS